MTRAAVTIREATAGDVPDLLRLWEELRDRGPRRTPRAASSDALESAEHRFVDAIKDDGCRLLVAEVDDDVVGMALLSLSSASTVLDLPALELSHVWVADRHRRRGVGKALVTAASTYADECGVDQVVVSVYPQHRDANRFYARLGFAPMVIRRAAPLAVLRRQLAAEDGRSVILRRELRRRRGVGARERAAGRALGPVDGHPSP